MTQRFDSDNTLKIAQTSDAPHL
ncbi:protein of unknown function [Modestobacter italicus]|uniref:Uncharacterized protein n=1 Tax=Modestobacter italicus (strain DSM 44449 / CECT 9708 / BC 501) TaxID=2732864 RepID=I4ES01_MODI5|nr:protein of unknown function [Modestobacter marinus]